MCRTTTSYLAFRTSRRRFAACLRTCRRRSFGRFVAPYRRGKNILCGREVVEVSRIRTVSIVRTADTSETELKRIDEERFKKDEEFNRSSRSVVVLHLGYKLEDIGEAGEDVTSTFILGPPGHGDRWTVVAAVLNHPWITAIGTGLILAAIIWWLGWN
jgi:hypothetical protein